MTYLVSISEHGKHSDEVDILFFYLCHLSGFKILLIDLSFYIPTYFCYRCCLISILLEVVIQSFFCLLLFTILGNTDYPRFSFFFNLFQVVRGHFFPENVRISFPSIWAHHTFLPLTGTYKTGSPMLVLAI